MGPLGDFTVYVYNDGFIVKSRTDGDIIEISNVGQDLMFVRDSNKEGSAVVIGDQSGQVSSCTVSVRFLLPRKTHMDPQLWYRRLRRQRLVPTISRL